MKFTKFTRLTRLILFGFTLLISSINLSLYHCATFGNETDKLALLAFKAQITHDPLGALSSWNDSLPVCQWHGVICGIRHRRVKALDVRNSNLTGTISPFIGNLTFLRGISLENNDFHGNIPQEIGRLLRLEVIVFRQNSLEGEIPINLTQCSKLNFLELFMNKLVGNILVELGNLSNLVGLGLSHNNFTGSIPQSLSNLTSLEQLSLSENSLSGRIPNELGQLSQLKTLQLSSNMFLTGSVPIKFFNISSIDYFAVADNQLSGEIPPYIGQSLPNLRILLLGKNGFTGSIPPSISNATGLQRLDFSGNNFTGSIPVNLGTLTNLTRLNFAKNNLGGDLRFLNSLVNCTSLEVLSVSFNNLSGMLHDNIANLSSHLTFLAMGANRISGSIPTGIENLENLISIGMEENLLTGIIPSSIGNLMNLQVLSMFGNKFSGEIPASLGNIPLLTELDLANNTIQGTIPSSLGNCRHLQRLSLWGNNLSGTLPPQVIGLPSLSEWLDLSQNHLTGLIPSEIGNLRGIQLLDLSDNNLSGEIPSSLENCNSLERLLIGGNLFRGAIPLSLSSLRGIQDIDLSRNNFSGKIPNFLGNFTFLRNLNLSFNNLEGEVPKEGIFKNSSAVAIIGNENLCGGIPEFHLPTCLSINTNKNKRHLPLFIIILIVCSGIFLILVCLFAILYWRKSSRRKPSVESPLDDKSLKVSYAELLKATDGFSSSNLIGTGSYGSVYKGLLGQEETVVAVKVLNLQQSGASKSFVAECEALRCIRHRNLVKIITSCSSMDFKGNEFRALVFDFMPNGSLEKWLYREVHDQNQNRHYLNLMQRLNIAIDVAHALDYLHNHCHTPIVHCDLKPSNVLLDHDKNAHVGDFGLARFLVNKDSENQTFSSRLKGSIGYVAPEYGVAGKASTEGDVYSYGILLLEMFTGKRPTDDMFNDGLSLHSFVKMAIPDRVVEVADQKFLEDVVSTTKDPNIRNRLLGSLTSIFRTGVSCSAEFPRERMGMKEVVMELQAVRARDTLLGVNIQE